MKPVILLQRKALGWPPLILWNQKSFNVLSPQVNGMQLTLIMVFWREYWITAGLELGLLLQNPYFVLAVLCISDPKNYHQIFKTTWSLFPFSESLLFTSLLVLILSYHACSEKQRTGRIGLGRMINIGLLWIWDKKRRFDKTKVSANSSGQLYSTLC